MDGAPRGPTLRLTDRQFTGAQTHECPPYAQQWPRVRLKVDVLPAQRESLTESQASAEQQCVQVLESHSRGGSK